MRIPPLSRAPRISALILCLLFQTARGAEDDFPALFLSQPATNFHSTFTFTDWKFDNRDDPARQAITAPSVFRVYHLHMNHHASHLNSDADTGAQFLNFHQTLIASYNVWRMERGLEASLSYVACNPMPVGHTELNNGLVRPPGAPMEAPCAPMPLGFRIPPIGTLGQAGAAPPLNSYNAVGHSLNLTWHSGTHFALGYRSLLEDGRNGDMGSTDKSPLDPAFWMWHAAVADVADVWLRTQPTDVVVAVDRSGSMGLPMSTAGSTTRLAASQEALQFLGRLIPQVVPGGDGRPHRLALVSFNDAATTQLNFTALNSAGFASAWSNAVASLTASGASGIPAGINAARDLALSGTNENRAVLVLSDGSTGSSSSLCSACGTNCQCTGGCSCGGHDHGNGHGPTVPVHTIAVGPSWYETGSQLTRTAVHQAGIPWSADHDAFQLKQRMIHFLAQEFEAGVSLTTNLALPSGTTRSTSVSVPLSGDPAVTFVLLWDRPVPPGNLTLEVTSPAGTVLNLGNPAIGVTTAGLFQIVRVGVPPSGGNDGSWTVRATRRTGSGPGEDQRLHIAVLGNGWGRVEPAPSTPYAYTGEPVRVTFRVRESYWPTNGFDSVTASAIVTGPTTGTGEATAGLSLGAPASFQGDERSSLQLALDGIASSLASRTHSNLNLSDGGPGPDGLGGDRHPSDHYYSAWFVPTRDGDHQFAARFTFLAGGRTFVREAHYSLRVQTRMSTASQIAAGIQTTNLAGEIVTPFTFTPLDILNQKVGPGRANEVFLRSADEGLSVGTVTDLGGGAYQVTTTGLVPGIPSLTTRQPGRNRVSVGTTQVPAFASGPEVYSHKPGEAIVVWSTTTPATALVEAGESIGTWTSTAQSPSGTEHRIALTGLRGNRRYFIRITNRHASGREVRSQLVEFVTPPPAVTRITVDRLGYNGAVSNWITGRIFLSEPLEQPRTVALSTAQTFNTDNPFTNATATVTIPANTTSVDWSLLAGPVERDVELHASVLLGDFPPHVILKLLPPDTQVLTAGDPAGPFTTNSSVRIDPYHRILELPVQSDAALFLKLQAPTESVLTLESAMTERIRIRY